MTKTSHNRHFPIQPLKASLLPEPIRIIGPHFARAGCGSHAARIREKRATGESVGKRTPPPPPPCARSAHRRPIPYPARPTKTPAPAQEPGKRRQNPLQTGL
eukprot:gene24289-biopygen13435